MAQSLIAIPSETVFAECRAFVFFYDIQLNQWSQVAETNVYSRIQLLCSRPPGSTGLYRILGRLETTGMVRSIVTCSWLIKHKVASVCSLNLPYTRCTGGQRMNTPPLTFVLLVYFYYCCHAIKKWILVCKSFALSAKWACRSKWFETTISRARKCDRPGEDNS